MPRRTCEGDSHLAVDYAPVGVTETATFHASWARPTSSAVAADGDIRNIERQPVHGVAAARLRTSSQSRRASSNRYDNFDAARENTRERCRFDDIPLDVSLALRHEIARLERAKS